MRSVRFLLFLVFSLAISDFASGQAPVARLRLQRARDTAGCAPHVLTFADSSVGTVTSRQFTTSNGLSSTTTPWTTVFSQPGTYTVRLRATNSNGSSFDSMIIRVYANPQPTFVVSDTIGCVPLNVVFNPTGSTPGSGTIVRYVWFWGDGSRDTVTTGNPIVNHTYTTPNNNTTPVLQMTNSFGCSQVFPQPNQTPVRIRVGAGVIPRFADSVVKTCIAPLTVIFTNNSTGDVANADFTWTFGDNSPPVQDNTLRPGNVIHNYSVGGIYPVKLVAVSANGCRDSATTNVAVTGFETRILAPDTLCARVTDSVRFTSNATLDANEYNWSLLLPNGTTVTPSTQQRFTYLFSQPGSYIFSLYVNYGSCDTTIRDTILVLPNPVVNIQASDSASCTRPLSVNFSTNSAGNTYQWTFTGATPASSTAQNPSGISYPNFGNFSVKLVVSSGLGCRDSLTRTNYIRLDTPRGTIAAPPRLCSGPAGYTPIFSGTAPDTVRRFLFTFQQLLPAPPGPVISQTVLRGQPITPFPIPVAGTYRITMRVESNGGCISSPISRDVIVGDRVDAFITHSRDSLCPEDTMSFRVVFNAGTATGYAWNFGTNAVPLTSAVVAPPPVRYTRSGEKIIALTLTSNNCETVIRDTIVVKPPTAIFTPQLLDCVGGRTQWRFRNQTLDTARTNDSTYRFEWVYGFGLPTPIGTSNNINPVQNFPNAGPFQIWLRATDPRPGGCTDTTVQTIFSIPAGSSTFDQTRDTVCKGETVTFTVTPPFASAITNYNWRVTLNGNVIFTNNGSFSSRTVRMNSLGKWVTQVTITDRNACTEVFRDSGYVVGMRPGFTITPRSGCTNDLITFTDTATAGTGGPIVSRRWVFGDGNTNVGNAQTIQYGYPTEGTYSPRLFLADANGCQDSVTQNAAVIIGNAKADFWSIDSMSCPGQTVQFTDTSKGNLTRWKWYFSFGNNNSLIDSSGANPSHVYGINDTGVLHTIKLVVTAVSGCKDSIEKPAYVMIKKPRALFNPLDTISKCPPLIIDYRDSSYYVRSWSWNFDDLGAVSADTNPSHTFLIPRIYQPYLVVTSPGGCTDTARARVQVDGPYGALTYGPPRIACDSLVVNNLKVESRLASAYLWLYGDGTSLLTTRDTLQRHTYRWDSASNGRFIPSVVLFDTTYFTDPTNSCRVALQGNYVGIDTFNQDRSDDTLLVVYAKPYSFADKFLLCDSGTITFRDSTITNVDVIHSWDFGDGTTPSTDVNPTHFYASPGNYTVKHNVTSLGSVQCQDTATYLTIRVVASPQGVILLPSGDSLCRPAPFVFAGSRVTPDTSNINLWTWDWRFGNGATANVQNPATQVFPNSGTFPDTLIVRNASGCVDTTTRSVFVPGDNDLIVGFTRSLQVLCDSGTVQFTDTSIINVGGTRTYNWSFGNGPGTSSLQNPTRFYGTPGLYDVKLVISTTKNCIDSFTAPIRVIRRADSLQLAFSATPRQLCDSGVVNFTDNSLIRIPGSFTYSWNFGDNTALDSRQNPDHKYTALGSYPVTLRLIASQPSCSDSLRVNDFIRVVGKPVPVININPNDSLCFPALFVFTGSNTDTSTIVNWQWTLGNGQTFTGPNPPPQAFNTVGSFVNTLVATNATGCSQTVSRPSTVMPLPNLTISKDTTICRDQFATLNVAGAATYEWVPTQNLSNPTGATTLANPALDRRYVVTGTSSFGCKADTSVLVRVFQPYQLSVAQIADTICGNGSTQLEARGAPLYTWTPGTGLNATDVPNPIANPDVTTLYTVAATDSLNCFPQTATVEVRKFSFPIVNIGPDVILNAGTNYTFNPTVSSDVIAYQWVPPIGLSSSTIRTPSIIATANTTYVLTVTNDGQCKSSDTVRVLVTCDNGNVYMPNTFSPNNDGINDRFTPRGVGLSAIRSMRIFNRWGKMVFEKRNLSPNNLNEGWDGKIEGKAPQSDAYVYMVEIQCSTGQILKYTGTVTLVN